MAVTKVAMIAQKAVAAKSRSARADRKLGISVGTEALRGRGGVPKLRLYFELRKVKWRIIYRSGKFFVPLFSGDRSKISNNETNKFTNCH